MKRLLIFSSIVLFVTACGTSSAGDLALPPTAVPSTPTPIVSPSPTVTISPATRLLLGVYDNNSTPNGSETLTLLDGGRYTLQVPKYRANVRGSWAVLGEQTVFTETIGGDCSGFPGTYKLAMNGTALTFTKVKDDNCSVRAADLTSGPWIKEP
jgi:hypothetical protein